MNFNPELVKLLTGSSIQKHQDIGDQWIYRKIIDAQRQALGTAPSEEKFNGVIDPGDVPNSLYYDPDSFARDLATKQSMEQPDYLPPIPEDLKFRDDEQMRNMLRLLENYNRWSQGERH